MDSCALIFYIQILRKLWHDKSYCEYYSIPDMTTVHLDDLELE